MCNNQPAEEQKQARKLHHTFSKSEKTEGQEAASFGNKASNLRTANLIEQRICPMDKSMMMKMTAEVGIYIVRKKKFWYALIRMLSPREEILVCGCVPLIN